MLTKANHLGRLASGLCSRVRLFRDQDYSLTALLVMLVVTLFVVTPLASCAIIGSQIVLCSVAVLTVIGVTIQQAYTNGPAVARRIIF